MKLVIVWVGVLLSLPTWATVTVGAKDCPTQFEGRVKQIIEPLGASDFFSTSRVILTNQRTLKGNVEDQISLEVLQNGPFKVELDKEYRVQTRNGKLCWMEEI